MLDTIIGALLPVVLTLLFGFFAGWHRDFGNAEASTLNRMVMLYALPLSLFAGVISTSRTLVLEQGLLAILLFVGLVGSYLLFFAASYCLFHRPRPVAALQAFSISGPSIAFVGFPVLESLFGSYSTMPIAIGNLIMNVILVPMTLYMLESAQPADAGSATSSKGVGATLLSTFKEPMVWAPFLGFFFLLVGLRFPPQTAVSLDLLGKVTGGVSIFAAGVVLYSRKINLSWSVAASVLSRNILIPGIMLGGCMLFGLGGEITRAAVLTLAIPTASLSVILAVQYQVAEQEMASVLFFSTVLSVLTMGGLIGIVHG